MVSEPVLLRPPVRCLTPSRGLCGLSVVISSLTRLVVKRSDGVIGRNDLIGIVFIPLPAQLIAQRASVPEFYCGETSRLETVEVFRHLFAFFEANVGLLPVGTVAGELAPPALLALDGRGSNTADLDLEETLNSLFDFGLGGLEGNFEHQSVLRL